MPLDLNTATARNHALAELIGLDHVRKGLGSFRKLVAKHRGQEVTADDDMLVQGDLHVESHGQQTTSGTSGLLGKLLLTGAALAAGGIPLAGKTLLGHVLSALTTDTAATAFEDTDTDTTIGLGSITDLTDEDE